MTGAEPASAANLIGRWGMNEGSGTTIANSAGTTITGTLTPTATPPTWVTGFPLPDLTPPAAPINVIAQPGNSVVTITWDANTETDLAGYNIYRSTAQPVPTTGTITSTRPISAAGASTSVRCAFINTCSRAAT